MKVHNNFKLFSAYVDQQLDERDASLVCDHIRVCGECRQTVKRIGEAAELLAGAGEAPPPPSLNKDIMDCIEREASRPRLVIRRFLPVLGTLSAAIILLLVMRNMPEGEMPPPLEGPAEESRSMVYRDLPEAEDAVPAAPDDRQPARDMEEDSSISKAPVVSVEKEVVLPEAPGVFEASARKDSAQPEEMPSPLPVEEPLAARPMLMVSPDSYDAAVDAVTEAAGMDIPPGIIVVEEQAEWDIFFKGVRLEAGSHDYPADINFNEYKVVAVPLSWDGKAYRIDGIEKEGSLAVFYYTRTPVLREMESLDYVFYLVEHVRRLEFVKSGQEADDTDYED